MTSIFSKNAKAFLFGLSLVMANGAGSAPVFAASADLTLSPTRIIMDNGQRYATVNVKNAGDAAGRYHIEIVDAAMQPNGGVKLMDENSHDPFSAQPHIGISPRVMTLAPGDYQAIRVLVKDIGSLEDGEYRSALKVTMTESNVDINTNLPKKDENIVLQPKLVMAIPLIIRHGNTSFHVTMDEAQFVASGGTASQPQIHVSLGFEGTRSVIGDIKVTHVDAAGKDSVLKFFPGIAIYRGVPKIDIDVPLEIPAGVDLRSGKTTVSYMAQENDGGGVMAQKDVTP